jgi:uncharacterized protein YggE
MDQRTTRSAPLTALRRFRLHAAIAVGLLTTVVAAPFVVDAQTPTDVVTSEEMVRTITVSGTGSVNVDPDTADIIFSVQSDAVSLEDAQTDNSTRLQFITDELTAGGLAKEDIVTSGYYVTVMNEYDDDGNIVAISGYRINAEITATIRDLESVGALLDSVVGDEGANGVYGISFYVNDPAPAASEARKLAVEDAQAKANELAEASGVSISGVVSIEETYAPQPLAKDYYGGGYGGAADMEAASMPVPVNTGSTTVTVQVNVVFEVTQING